MRSLLHDLTPKRLIIFILIGIMYVIIFLSIVELLWTIFQDIKSPPVLILTSDELIDILGIFLLVLVGIELLDTVQVYLSEDEVHAEVVIEAALIAVARKVILLDTKTTPPVAVIGIGVIIIALAGGYYVLRLTHGKMTHRHTGTAGQIPGGS